MNYPFAVGAEDIPRLREEHAFSGRQLTEVRRLAQAGRPQQCELIWEVFVRELERHMQHEEELFLPAFAKSGFAPDQWASHLRAEHKEILRCCQAIGDQLVGRTQTAAELSASLADLDRQLLEHTEREGLVLYPWLAEVASSRPLFWRPRLAPLTPALVAP